MTESIVWERVLLSRGDFAAGADVVAGEELLVAEVEFTVGDDGMGPDSTVPAALGGLRVERELAVFGPFGGGCFDQGDDAFLFAEAIEAIIGIGNGAFADAFLRPDFFACVEFLADPIAAVDVGEAVNVVVVQNDAAVMIAHDGVLVDLVHFVVRANLEELAHASVVTSGDVNFVSLHDGCGNDSDFAGVIDLPEELAILGVDTGELSLRESDELAGAINIGGDDG